MAFSIIQWSAHGKRFSNFEAWLWLLFEAVWKSQRIRVTNGRAAEYLTLERGQLSHSRSYMANAWGWTEKRVRGFLFRLERDRQIELQTGHLQTVITICNYELYQNPLATKGQQTGQQTDRHWAGKGPEEEQGNKVTDGSGGVECARPAGFRVTQWKRLGFADELSAALRSRISNNRVAAGSIPSGPARAR